MNRKLAIFKQKLLEWNKIHNLTGAMDEQTVDANIEDSLYPLQFLPDNIEKALDIGTGAGFPGLVLAIAMPNTKWTLSEPRKKRASFLHYIKTLLNLENVQVQMKRVEELEPQPFDLITSRAVMPALDLIELTKGFIAPHTTILLYKGERAKSEVEMLEHYTIYPHGKRNYLLIKGEDVV